MSHARHPWWLGAAALAGTGVVRLFGATWRYDVADRPEYTAAAGRGERFVYAFWHSGLLMGAMLHPGEGIAVLVSQHRDGEWIARIIGHLGYVAARGSSTRGGDAGVRELLAWAERGRHLALTPDGPRGPAERMKDGAYYVAARTGRRVVPIGFGVRSAWVLRSWDRFRVPRPFARICVSHGAPIAFDPPQDDGAVARARAVLDEALGALTREARERVGEVL
jgi:lysophospholipid acyltransferase (LPLAT)-like uncharacterized protein